MQIFDTNFFNKFWLGIRLKTRPKAKKMFKYKKFLTLRKLPIKETHENNVILLYFPKLKIRKFSLLVVVKRKLLRNWMDT